MSVFLVQKYVIQADRRGRFKPLLKEFLAYKEAHAELFKGLRTWKLFKQNLGDPSDLYIEMWEYEDITGMDAINKRIFADVGMKKISDEFHDIIEPATFSQSIWNAIV